MSNSDAALTVIAVFMTPGLIVGLFVISQKLERIAKTLERRAESSQPTEEKR